MNPIYKSRQKLNSSRTKVVAFRATLTQAHLLERDYGLVKSAALRVLLTLLFNKKIPNFEALLSEELELTEKVQDQALERHRERMKIQKEEKAQERAVNNGNGSSSRKGMSGMP